MAAPRILPLCNQTFPLNFDSQMSATTRTVHFISAAVVHNVAALYTWLTGVRTGVASELRYGIEGEVL